MEYNPSIFVQELNIDKYKVLELINSLKEKNVLTILIKKENDNIKFLFDYIQVNGSENLSKLFRINFLKIDEIQKEYISIIYNCYDDVKKEILDFHAANYLM